VVARRPPNRKELIRAGATELFLQRGYHNVSVADVADALGITASALYHHYRNKQDLLLQVVLGGLDTVDDLLRQADGLDTALRGLAALVVGPRRTVAMWERQARHLDPAQREVLVARQAEVVAHLVPLLRGARPGLSDADGELIARAVLGVFGSPARHRLTLPRRRHENLLFRLGAIAAHSELPKRELLPDHSDQGRRGTTAGLRPPRRDQLLTEAIRLFDERGYSSVAMSDIGAAAGIVASGVYRHFANKTDLLVAATNRAAERVRASAEQAMTEAADPREALELLLGAHVTLVIDQRHLVGILVTESDQLPERERVALRRLQADYLEIWVQALRSARPDRDPTELKIVIHAVQATIYFVVRSGHVALRPDLDGAWLTHLGLALLLGGRG